MSIFKRVVSTLRPDRSTQPAEQNQQPPGEPTSSDRAQTNSDIVSPPDTEAISGQTTSQVASAAADEVTRTNEKIEGVEEAIRATKEAIKDTNEAIKEQKQRLEDLEDSRPTKGGYENAADFRKAQAAHQVAVSEAQEAVRDLDEELNDLNERAKELNEEARELNDVLDKLEDQIEELNEQTDDGEPADSHDVERADNTADDTGAALGRDDEPDPRDRLTREDVFGEADAIEGEVEPPADDQQALMGTLSGIHKEIRDTQESIVRNMLSEEPDSVENYDLSGLEPPDVAVAPHPPDASVVPGGINLEESLQQASEATPFAAEVLQSVPDEGMIDILHSVGTGEDQFADGETPEVGSPEPAVAVLPASSKGGGRALYSPDVVKTPVQPETGSQPYSDVASETGAVAGARPATAVKGENPAGQSGDAVSPLEGDSGVAASRDYMEDPTDDDSPNLSADFESALIPDLPVEDPATLSADVAGGETHLGVDDTVEQAGVDLHAPNVIKDGLEPDDGIPDLLRGEEGLGFLGTDPKNPDTDFDGLSDADEVNVYGTNPATIDLPPPTALEDAIAGVDAEALTIEQDFDPSLIVAEPLEDIGRGPFDQPGIGSGDIPEIGLEDGDGETALDDTDGADLGDWRDDNSDSG